MTILGNERGNSILLDIAKKPSTFWSSLRLKFAIIGDTGINKEVPENFWNEIEKSMSEKFKLGEFTEGLIVGIVKAGERLKKHFPHHIDDINELSDEISFGD